MQANNKAYKYIYNQNLMGRKASVHTIDKTRFTRANEQMELPIVDRREVIRYTNDFLKMIEMKEVENPIVTLPLPNQFYKRVAEENNLKDINDMVWMKFTTDGYLGVVAVSNDIHFNIPSEANDYISPGDKSKWEYNTSGIIVHQY